MKPAEFEEKEYEGALYRQLETGNLEVWTPGQVLERHFGIDHAAMVTSSPVWGLIRRHVPPGVFMNRYDWDPMWDRRPRRMVPNFRLNLFIQAKRPAVHGRFPSPVAAAGLHAPGWSFDTQEHQQHALEAVANTIGARAAIVYAAPAFDTVRALFAHTRNGTVVQNSTFPDVEQLRGHVRWYYNAPGANGVANPDFEESSGPSLEERIAELRRIAELQRGESSEDEIQALGRLANGINSAMEELSEANPRAEYFLSELRALDRELAELQQPFGIARDFGRIGVFANTFNVEWLVI